MNLDAIINIVSFVVGLTIGLVQLYVAQHQFEVQQREKMDELRKTLTDILQKVAVLEATNSSRAFDIQDKMLQMAAGKAAISEFTEETSSQIKGLVEEELKAAGVPENVEQMKRLEAQVASIVKSTVNSTGIVRASTASLETDDVMQLIGEGFSDSDIANHVGWSVDVLSNFIKLEMAERGFGKREQLVSFYKSTMPWGKG